MPRKGKKSKVRKAPKRPPGRPTIYTKKLFTEICEKIAAGDLLKAICEPETMPSRATFYRWLFNGPNELRDTYARAREAQMDTWAEEIVEIADDGKADTYSLDVGGVEIEKVDYDVIQRSKLRVDTRKWLMAKLNSRKYGDKLAAEVTGKDGGPVQGVVNVTIGVGGAPAGNSAGSSSSSETG